MKKNIIISITSQTFRFSVIILFALSVFISCIERKISTPNILWIIAEDLSPDLGCYGNVLVKTPELDSMARNGVRFNNVFTTAPVCTPSRSALATGMYQTTINAHHQRYPEELKNPLPGFILPLNEILRRGGYQTVNIKDAPGTGKTDWSFKSEYAEYEHSRWEDIENDKPFFAVVNLRLTHRPFEHDTIHPVDPKKVQLPPYYPDNIVARNDVAHYLESVQLMDRQVGMVRDKIREMGWSENTIVIFFSDHGRPFTHAKTFLYDSGLKIPLIIFCPENMKWHDYLPKGTVNSQMISLIDITATSLSIAGISKPQYLQGRVIFGPDKEAPRKYIYSAMDRMGEIYFKSRSVRSPQFRYIRNYNTGFSVNAASTAYWKAKHPIFHLLEILGERNQLNPVQKNLLLPLPYEELYNIQTDPFEIVNLAADPAFNQELEDMREQLEVWQEEAKDFGMSEDPPELVKYFIDYGIQSEALNGPAAAKMRKDVLNELNGSDK